MPGDPLRASGSWLFGFASKPICLLSRIRAAKHIFISPPTCRKIQPNRKRKILGCFRKMYNFPEMTEQGVPYILLPLPSKTLLQRKQPLRSGKAQNKTSQNKRHWRSGRAGARPPGGRVFVAQHKQGLFGGLERGLRRGGTPLTGPFPPPGGQPTTQNEQPASARTTSSKQRIFSLPAFKNLATEENPLPSGCVGTHFYSSRVPQKYTPSIKIRSALPENKNPLCVNRPGQAPFPRPEGTQLRKVNNLHQYAHPSPNKGSSFFPARRATNYAK